MYNMLHRKISTRPNGTTFYTSNLQPGEIIHMDFVFYNVTSIIGLNYILTIVCANNIILWVFHNTSRQSPGRIIHFFLTTLKNKQHPRKCVRIDEDYDLENSTYFTN